MGTSPISGWFTLISRGFALIKLELCPVSDFELVGSTAPPIWWSRGGAVVEAKWKIFKHLR